MISNFIGKKMVHNSVGESDWECPDCHNIVVATQFSHLFLDPRVKKLNLEMFDDSTRRELMKSISLFKGKTVLVLSVMKLPICIMELNMSLKNLNTLRFLTMDFAVQNETLTALGRHCPLLEHLEIDRCYRLKDSGLKDLIAGCKNLRNLIFISPSCISTEGFVDALLSLPKLEYLGRAQSILVVLAQVYQRDPYRKLKLKHFENTYSEILGNNGLALELLTNVCPDLVKLNVHVSCPNLISLSNLKKLAQLHLKGLTKAPHHRNLIEVLKHIGKQLVTLEIRKTTELTNEDLETIGYLCPNVTNLILQQCSTLNEWTNKPSTFTNAFKSLKVFYFSPYNTSDVNDVEAIVFTLKNALNVEQVYIEGCRFISDAHFKELLEFGALGQLQKLQVTMNGYTNGLEELTFATVLALTTNCPDLVVVGELYKWNLLYKYVKDMRRVVKEKNIKLDFSKDCLKQFHDKVFFH
jgi:hypothetical protein